MIPGRRPRTAPSSMALRAKRGSNIDVFCYWNGWLRVLNGDKWYFMVIYMLFIYIYIYIYYVCIIFYPDAIVTVVKHDKTV